MKRGERWSILTCLVSSVLAITRGRRWLGRTHIQKGAFFLQEFSNLDLGYDFVIYQYGPYSFELDADVADLVQIGALQVDLVGGYPDYTVGANSLPELQDKRIQRAVEVVADQIANRQAKDLELLSTIAFVRHNYGIAAEDALARQVHQLKPHFSVDEIKSSTSELNGLLETMASVA